MKRTVADAFAQEGCPSTLVQPAQAMLAVNALECIHRTCICGVCCSSAHSSGATGPTANSSSGSRSWGGRLHARLQLKTDANVLNRGGNHT